MEQYKTEKQLVKGFSHSGKQAKKYVWCAQFVLDHTIDTEVKDMNIKDLLEELFFTADLYYYEGCDVILHEDFNHQGKRFITLLEYGYKDAIPYNFRRLLNVYNYPVFRIQNDLYKAD